MGNIGNYNLLANTQNSQFSGFLVIWRKFESIGKANIQKPKNWDVHSIGQHLKIPVFHFFHDLGKIGQSSLEQHSKNLHKIRLARI